jgi:hypothetical protein
MVVLPGYGAPVVFLNPEVPRWTPSTEEDIRRAAEVGVLEESHWWDAEREPSPNKSANKRLADSRRPRRVGGRRWVAADRPAGGQGDRHVLPRAAGDGRPGRTHRQHRGNRRRPVAGRRGHRRPRGDACRRRLCRRHRRWPPSFFGVHVDQLARLSSAAFSNRYSVGVPPRYSAPTYERVTTATLQELLTKPCDVTAGLAKSLAWSLGAADLYESVLAAPSAEAGT